MTKKVIAIISILKPIDDTRNYEKIARSIGNTNKYDINIIGFLPKKIPDAVNTVFHPIFNFHRLSLKRFLAPLKIFNLLLKLKPELIIVTCTDLLIVSILNKILFGTKIIYDIQENYYRNIIYSGAYSTVIKYPLAWIVRITEMLSAPLVDKFILAEKIYSKQLHFTSSKSVVVENMALIPKDLSISKSNSNSEIVLLYSGTISAHYGIFEAIELVQRLKNVNNNISLRILGYASQTHIRNKLIKLTEGLNFISIIGIDRLVPHDQILTEMNNVDFCILPYQFNQSTSGRIPTKLYECLAMEKPVIINSNETWNNIIEQNNAGIIYDFNASLEFPEDKLNQTFYGKNRSNQYKWENNSAEIVDTVKNLIG